MSAERLEVREYLAGDPIITEFVASNEDTLTDGNGATSDWLEIYNPGQTPVNLAGWHLTDVPTNRLKWTFPSRTIAPGGYLVVFASGNNVPDAGGNLHTNFQLDNEGDYLALVKPDGTTLTSEFNIGGVNFPSLNEDVGYGLGQSSATTTLVGVGAPAQTLIPTVGNGGSTLGTSWTGAAGNEPFNTTGWTAGNTGVGYGDFTPPIQIAGELIVDLDAAHASAGTASWTNAGTLGNFAEVGNPTVVTLEGRRGVQFNATATLDSYQSPVNAPAGLVGLNPTRTIEAWVQNSAIADEETIVSWGRRGGPAGTNMSFNYGNNVNFGAIGHWDAPDIGWGTVPLAGQWNHVVYTYDGTTTRVFVNGVQTNIEVLGEGIINTFSGSKITLAAQLEANLTLNAGLRGTLTIGKMRIHDGVLSPDQIAYNHSFERPLFPLPAPPTPAPLTAPPQHRYSFNDGTANDSVGTIHGALMGGATIASGSVSLSGASQYVNFPSNDIAALSATNGAVTIEAWGNYNSATGTWSRIFDFGAISGTNGRNYVFATPRSGAGGTRAAISDADPGFNNENIAESGTTATSVPTHFVAVFDDANNLLTTYVNGVPAGGTTMTIPLSAVATTNAFLGRALYSADPYLTGSINEFRVYNYALTRNQALGNFNAGPDVVNLGGSPPAASFDPPSIDTNVQQAMQHINSSAFVRTTFNVADPTTLSRLTLKMQYDDGFVAYLNGVEVSRRNAPASVAWDSAATASRSIEEAILAETIDLSGHLTALRAGTNVLAIHGLNSSASDNDFLILPQLEAQTITTGGLRYFTQTTPGAVNNGGVIDFVKDTMFSHDRGFYDAPFDVTVSSLTPGATIVYTTNGSEPTLANGTQILPANATTPPSGVLNITRTTTLRAKAFKTDWDPTDIDTQSYIFVANTLTQNTATATANGHPVSWGPNVVDYEVDPDVINNPAYSGTFLNDLKTIPTVSIVVDSDDFFGAADGVYANAVQRGDLWERPVSIEWIDPANPTVTYQENGGVRAFGGVGRTATRAKHSLRIAFREQYGAPKFHAPIFPDTDVEDHNQLIIKMNWNYSWYGDSTAVSGLGTQAADYLRETYGRDTARDMGLPTAKGRPIQLYINGLYWGLYFAIERTDEQWAAETFGGSSADYDILKPPSESFANVPMEIISGERTAWDQLMAAAAQTLTTQANYDAVAAKVDIDQLIDYMLMTFYTGSRDAPTLLGTTTEPRNFFTVRNHGPGGDGKFRFLAWDFEWSLEQPAVDRVNLSYASGHDNPAYLFSRLTVNQTFKDRVADRVRKHFFDGGALTTAVAQARYLDRATEIDRAIVGESARWGDFLAPTQPFTRNVHWVAERDRIVNTFLGAVGQTTDRTNRVLAQLRTAGLYPALDAPNFAVNGTTQYNSVITAGSNVTVSDPNAPAGVTYYTIDGTDPRLTGVPAIETLLVQETTPAKVFVPTVANGGSTLGATWRGGAEPFNDAAWIDSPTGSGIGWDTTTAPANYNPLINLNIQTAMSNVNPSAFVRIAFNIPDQAALDAIEGLKVRLKFDDGVFAYINGTQVVSSASPSPSPLAYNSRNLVPRTDTVAVNFQDFTLAQNPATLLRIGTNIFSAQILNTAIADNDLLFVPQLIGLRAPDVSPLAQLFTTPFPLTTTTTVKSRVKRGLTWSALTESLYTVETPLRVTEINYHPVNPTTAEVNAGFLNDDDFEFIELRNVHATASVDLDGIHFDDGVGFTFGPGMLLPGERAVIVRNLAAFQMRYGTSIPVAGVYGGTAEDFRLSNNGENVTLKDAGGGVIQTFRFDDIWYPTTDGGGETLVIRSDQADRAVWSTAAGWQPSIEPGGSPGDVERLTGDVNGDLVVDVYDAGIVQSNLGLTGATLGQGDANRDGTVNRSDALVVLLNYGRRYVAPDPPPSPAGAPSAAVDAALASQRSSGEESADLAPLERPRAARIAVARPPRTVDRHDSAATTDRPALTALRRPAPRTAAAVDQVTAELPAQPRRSARR